MNPREEKRLKSTEHLSIVRTRRPFLQFLSSFSFSTCTMAFAVNETKFSTDHKMPNLRQFLVNLLPSQLARYSHTPRVHAASIKSYLVIILLTTWTGKVRNRFYSTPIIYICREKHTLLLISTSLLELVAELGSWGWHIRMFFTLSRKTRNSFSF